MSSGFVSETEIAEQRRRRQEEWEKVRTAEQPLEVPEEVYDHRSLFDRLEEQRKKKDEEYEEAHKLKNMVRGLDDDEVEFLDTVERVKETVEKRVRLEERKEMDEFRNAVASLQEQSLEQRLQQEISKPALPVKTGSNKQSSQMKLLAGAVVRKRPANDPNPPSKKACIEKNCGPPKESKNDAKSSDKEPVTDSGNEEPKLAGGAVNGLKAVAALPSNLKCIGILPGLGSYPDSSDSDHSSASDGEMPAPSRFDLLGRSHAHHKQVKEQQQN